MIDKRGVVGMIGAAKTSKNIYNDLRRVGFEDDEFPEWWYSPARVVDESKSSASESGRVSGEQTRLVVSDSVPDESKVNDSDLLRPHIPRTPPLGKVAEVGHLLQDRTTQHRTTHE